MSDSPISGYDVAIVGMAGRFPGARNVSEFWSNLRDGVESVTFFTDDELREAGERPENIRDPSYVKAQPVLRDFDHFDAGFFGLSPQDAAIMDPQHRVFLEVGWEALEDAGHTSDAFPGSIGVFATCGMNTYMMYNLVNNRRVMQSVGEWLVRHTGNDVNFLATRLSYAMSLTGPSMNVQTACSSALVAVHLACQSLLSGECDLALAGGCTIALPQGRGYFHKQGEILSPDGHCRAFDAEARGTLFGSGAGVVALRRLADAVADGDQVLAVVKGSAINNDGSLKVGYLAPSVEGQAKAVAEALAVSGVDPETIRYVEMHGTGTIVGDPIEVTALTQAWRQFTDKSGFCAIGSLKPNIGHLGEAAGVAGLIKTILALKHRQLPPSLNYTSPNPQIDFAASPFFVNADLSPWPADASPARAAVTSLGAGGTNCHVIVEEAPAAAAGRAARPAQALLLSARSPGALGAAAQNLAAYLREHQEADLADIAYTLQVGRKPFAHRLAIACEDRDQAIAALEAVTEPPAAPDIADRPVAFLFPGQGSQYPRMGWDLYQSEPLFREEVDACARLLKEQRDLDILPLIFSDRAEAAAQETLNQTAIAQPALFIVEYALARLWMDWGVQPRALIGHSIGEYVAACLAGVFSLADALSLVADRGSLMQQAPRGAMLALPMSAAEATEALKRSAAGAELSLAAVNGPGLSVVSGTHEAVAAFDKELSARGVQGRRLQTSHAFHSQMMEPALAPFRERVRRMKLQAPSLPFLSNLSGTWIRPEEATDPEYWVRHLRGTVQYSDGVATLIAEVNPVLLEVGPGHTLGSLARQQKTKPVAVLTSLPRGEGSAVAALLKSYGELWRLGCKLDPDRLYAGQQRRRLSLPTYPFEHKRYWVDPDVGTPQVSAVEADLPPRKRAAIEDWFTVPSWRKAPAPEPADDGRDWLIFADETGVAEDVVGRLSARGSAATDAAPQRLEVAVPGQTDSVVLLPFERPEVGSGQVEIRVRAVGMNFADVLKAAGAFAEAPFGMECAGVVERVGRGVRGLRVGDEVVAIGPDSFRSHVVRDARHVTRKPPSLSLEEAATLPAAFMTAWYALHHVARLTAGETVLIHAGSGGVGLAAVQAARLLGAEVICTAGNAEKRAFLQSLGIRHVFDSRSVSFADGVMECSGGKGVDVVLNSLTGDFIPKSFSVLRGGGRFVEIGKREIYTEAQLAELRLPPETTYHPVDLTQVLRDDPDGYGALLREIVEQANSERIVPPRHKVFPIRQAAQAFQLMLQARHIGKLILSFEPTAHDYYRVRTGREFARTGEREFTIRPGAQEDYVALLDELEHAGADIGHVAHLWTVGDNADDGDPHEKGLERGFFSLTWLGRALGNRGWTRPIELCVVSTGLQQIAGETPVEPAKAALLGPCRVLPRELTNLACRSIDIPASRPGTWQRSNIAAQLAAELTAEAAAPTVAYRGSDRWEECREPAPLTETPLGPSALRPGGVYMITGGLGGLGLEVAEHLSRAVKAKVILLGRRQLPPRNRWKRWLRDHEEMDDASHAIQKIEACERLGGEIVVAAADVTDAAQVSAAVDDAVRRFGTIHGIVHAAGTLRDGLIQLKTPDDARAVLAPKIAGALALDRALGDRPLDFFVMFSSVSPILGLAGQVDYAAANAFLDAFAEHRSATRPGHTVSVNWGAWQRVGMAARHGAIQTRPASGGGRTHHPWLRQRRDEPGAVAFSTAFAPMEQWVLGEHRTRGGDAVIPGTGYLELARAAFKELVDADAIEISRVFFRAPFVVGADETKELEIVLSRDGARWSFQVQSDNGDTVHVTGYLAALSTPPAASIDVAELTFRCDQRDERPDGFIAQEFMDFGPRWGNVRSICYGSREALLHLELPSRFVEDLKDIELHPALLDMATGAAQRLLPEVGTEFYVPFSYGRLVWRRGLPGKLYSHVRRRGGETRGAAVFDVTVTDEHGAVVVEITDFTMMRVGSAGALTGGSRSAAAAPAASASTVLAREILRDGMLPEEGLAAFDRILSKRAGPRIAVSPVDLQALRRRIDADAHARDEAGSPTGGTAGSEAGLASDGAATPGNVEQRLTALYAELLGVSAVGANDDFFELGGHSLLALRLIARIEKEFGTALSLPDLFERPTVAGLLSYLGQEETEAPKQPRAIVPLNEGGAGPAFYCVHSVGGEVMSFRHLAKLLGSELRFYGIQAPVECRNVEFASSVEQMAKFYADALVEFQPEGPFLLGGWSAGSVIALETAVQLQARGREVALLAALDGAPFNTRAGTGPANPLYYWKLLRNLPRWISDDLMDDWSASAFMRRIGKKLQAFFRMAVSAVRRDSSGHGHAVEGFLDTSHFGDAHVEFMKALFAALRRYVPSEYAGRVVVYSAKTQPLYHLLDVAAVWSKIARNVEVLPVRGTHISIIREPHVLTVADHLRQRLAEFGPAPEGEPARSAPEPELMAAGS